jgi:hypothetical protein
MPIPGFDGLERDADGNRFRWLPGIRVVGIGCYVTNPGRIDLVGSHTMRRHRRYLK